jgi:thymidylate synthase ThyX
VVAATSDRPTAGSSRYVVEGFTPEDRSRLTPYFSNLDGPVFALTNLPEAVKGALFARYSRTTKSLRRLFLDEFAEETAAFAGSAAASTGSARAERLYDNVFVEYGDDSVAQLGGVHLACEQSSQLLAKALEWGRLAAYLEQSTRYMRYDDKPGGRWRATVPAELDGSPLAARYEEFLDEVFTTYGRMYEPMETYFEERFPKEAGDSDFVYRQTMLAKTCDTLRVLLPAGTRSNLGIYATGQSYEQLLMRLAVYPLVEMREYGELMKVELRTVIPEFLKRVDVEERGVAWSRYWQANHARVDELTARVLDGRKFEVREEVNLVDHDPEGELKIAPRISPTISCCPSCGLFRPKNARRSCGRAWVRVGTGATSPAAPGSGPSIGSTCCVTTERSAISSVTDRSRSSGSGSRPSTATRRPHRSTRPACEATGTESWRRAPPWNANSSTPACPTSPSTRCRWPSASASSCR